MTRLPGKWAVLAALVGTLVLVDQWTKYLAVARLTTAFEHAQARTLTERIGAFYRMRHLEPLAREPYVVLRPVWRMSYVENPGAAWSLFRDLPHAGRQAFFGLVTAAAVAFILHYYRKLRDRDRILQLALSFVLAGAVGNFIDRLARGYVIDFVDWHWWNRPDLRWPTFNVADSLIVVGVLALVVLPSGRRKGGAPVEEPGKKPAGPAV